MIDLRLGDALALLQAMPEASVQCVVTSPPYWGLRDYQVDGQIGLEPTPDQYVATMVEIFREVRRVLRDDGICWLNLGDCYANDTKWGGTTGGKHAAGVQGTPVGRGKRETGLKAKDLVGIPWRVAFALQADGWYLRADVIWHKPNPMPESVTDRPTKSHEYLFLLTKSARYYWDAENAREQAVGTTAHDLTGQGYHPPGQSRSAGNRRPRKAVGEGDARHRTQAGLAKVDAVVWRGRNLRSVWTITTRPYPGAHFATFPSELPARCIAIGTPDYGCCSVCATPYTRLVEKGDPLADQQAACGADLTGGYTGTATKDYRAASAQDPSAVKARILAGMVTRTTVAWLSGCDCPDSEPVPSVVLDPFAGSGTTLVEAVRQGRRAIGLELNPEYITLAWNRLAEMS